MHLHSSKFSSERKNMSINFSFNPGWNSWRNRRPPSANALLLRTWERMHVSWNNFIVSVCVLVWVWSDFIFYHDSSCFLHCSPFNTKGALERAKYAVETQYAVVGVLEDLNTTLAVFEKYIPRFFAGATEIYYNEIKNFNKINKNNFKPPVSEEVKNLVRQNFSREIEFYKFCKQRLHTQFLAANLMDLKW